MSCPPTIVVENRVFPIVSEFSEAPPIAVSLPPAKLLDFSIAAPATLQFALVNSPVIAVTMPGVGIQGQVGPPGPRGSLFLGGYPSVANLPVPDGVHVKVGDFALVQNESAIYELE